MFNKIIDPRNKNSYSIFSKKGKDLLKLYIKNFNGGLQEVTQKKINMNIAVIIYGEM